MYFLKNGINIEATLEFHLGGKTCRLENVVLIVVGDQNLEKQHNNVKAQWKVGTNVINSEIPLYRVNNYSSFWVVPEEVV